MFYAEVRINIIFKKKSQNMLHRHDHLLVVAHGPPIQQRQVLDNANTVPG